jgi:hypothetical protein
MKRTLPFVLAVVLFGASGAAQAIPSFARKYGTSCQTCHTVYPKLTPFGEAFRRNGFRFPSPDSDYWKQEVVTLTPKAASGEANVLAAIPPLALGFNGQGVVHPDKNSGAGVADNHSVFVLRDVILEGHLWAGGSVNDKTTYFGEVTFGSDGSVDVEHAQVFFNDLLGPAHALNLRVGRGFANTSSFGVHSSYLADTRGVSLAVTGLNGATSASWNLLDHYNGVEFFGTLGGRFEYHLGLNAGISEASLHNAEDVYAHVGYKLGGMRMDGEGKSQTNPERPWEETSLTLEAFAYHAYTGTQFSVTDESGNQSNVLWFDRTHAIGGGFRAQLASLELNSGLSFEDHTHAAGDGSSATAISHFDELSYVVNRWLVPAIRFEYFSLSPASGPSVKLWRLLPGVAVAPYPNIKFTLVAAIEGATGAPPGGWAPVNGSVAPPDNVSTAGPEFESITLNLAFAF